MILYDADFRAFFLRTSSKLSLAYGARNGIDGKAVPTLDSAKSKEPTRCEVNPILDTLQKSLKTGIN